MAILYYKIAEVRDKLVNNVTLDKREYQGNIFLILHENLWCGYYRIQSNYRTYPYKCTVKQFRTLRITASVLYGYFFIKAYAVGTHLNCIDLSMQFKWVPTTCFYKEIQKKMV